MSKDHIQILCCPKLESKSEENLTTQRQQRQALNVESLQYIRFCNLFVVEPNGNKLGGKSTLIFASPICKGGLNLHRYSSAKRENNLISDGE